MKMSSILAAWLALCAWLPAPADAAPAASEAAARPARFSITVEGAGPDVIFIPGLTSSRKVWDAAVASLGGRYRVHRLQIAGFGGEPAAANAEGEMLPGIVAELNAYISAARLKEPAVVGHSMGGLISLMLAARHPAAVGRVLVVDALPFYSVLISPTATAETIKPQAASFQAALLAMPEDAHRAQSARTIAMLVKNDAARPSIEAAALASDRTVAAKAVYEVMTMDARPLLRSIKAPLTVAYAVNAFATEPMVGPLYRSGYAGAPGVRLIRVDDSYHFVMTDQPGRLAAILEDFLAAP